MTTLFIKNRKKQCNKTKRWLAGHKYVLLDICIKPYYEQDIIKITVSIFAFLLVLCGIYFGLVITTPLDSVMSLTYAAITTFISLIIFRLWKFAYQLSPYRDMLTIVRTKQVEPSILGSLIPQFPAEHIDNLIGYAKGLTSNLGANALWELPWLKNNDEFKRVVRNRVTDICVELIKECQATQFRATETMAPSEVFKTDNDFRNAINERLDDCDIRERKRILILDWCAFKDEFELTTPTTAKPSMQSFIAWNNKSGTTLRILVFTNNENKSLSEALFDAVGQHLKMWNFAVYGEKLAFAEAHNSSTIRITSDAPQVRTYTDAYTAIWDLPNTYKKHACVSKDISSINVLLEFFNQMNKEFHAINCPVSAVHNMSGACEISKCIGGCPIS